MRRALSCLIAVSALAGCSLAPKYVQPAAPVPAQFPQGGAYPAPDAGVPGKPWRETFTDPRLQSLVEQALASNQDVALALANVAAARARHGQQRAQLFPGLDVAAGYDRSGGSGADSDRFSVQAQVPGYEIDLFGRLSSLSGAARERWLASEEARRGVRLAVVSEVAQAWLAHAADASLLAVAKDTAASASESLRLNRLRLAGGVAPRTDVRQAEIVLRTAEADVADLTTALAQDRNALRLLLGAEPAEADLPQSIADADRAIGMVPAGLDSTVLLRRPDVMEAERELRAANAEIGAARAALFPKITLTGLLGFASDALGGLFSGGAFAWSGGIDAGYSIFSGGAGRAGVRLSEAQRDAALASYRKVIQTAFRDVADALARAGTIDAQLRAVEAGDAAAADNLGLATMRYRGGVDSYLEELTARQNRYTAARTLVRTRLLRAANRVELYRALGADPSL